MIIYDYLKTLYDLGKITDVHLANAVAKGWITTEQKNLILEIQII